MSSKYETDWGQFLSKVQSKNTKSEHRFMSPKEVAEVLAIPVSTIRFWVWSDSAPEGFPTPIKIGRLLKFPRDQVTLWIQEQIDAAKQQTERRIRWENP